MVVEDTAEMDEGEGPVLDRPASRSRLIPVLMLIAGGALIVTAVVLLYLLNRPAAGFPRIGARMADFSLPGLDGNPVRLSDYRGRTVLINAWASWCPPCRNEMPMLVTEYNQRKDSGFTILGINAGETREEAAAFAQEFGMDFPILLDQDSRLLESWLFDSLPTTILVGADGAVKAIHIGIISREEFATEFVPLIP